MSCIPKMMHVERMSNLLPTLLKYEHLKSWLVYLTDNDLTHVLHTSMVYNEEK
jgi:predicted ATPase with chaperone activity